MSGGAQKADPILITGWLVADVAAHHGFSYGSHEAGGRLSLFRTASDWTLLSVRRGTTYDANDRPVVGHASVSAATFASLDEVRAALARDEEEDWRRLVEVGAGNPFYDPDLMALWAPVQIDRDLERGSLFRRDLAASGSRRQDPGWREQALGLAVARLEELGFVVLGAEVDHRKVFPRGLGGEWSNPIVGAVVAARLGYQLRLVVAMDGLGEIYTRTPDTSFTPGTRRRYPPRTLTERESQRVEELRRRRREEAARQVDEEEDRG